MWDTQRQARDEATVEKWMRSRAPTGVWDAATGAVWDPRFAEAISQVTRRFNDEYRAWYDEAFPGHTIGDPYPAPPRRRRWWRRAT